MEDSCLGTFVSCRSAESCPLNPRRSLHPDRTKRHSTSLYPHFSHHRQVESSRQATQTLLSFRHEALVKALHSQTLLPHKIQKNNHCLHSHFVSAQHTSSLILETSPSPSLKGPMGPFLLKLMGLVLWPWSDPWTYSIPLATVSSLGTATCTKLNFRTFCWQCWERRPLPAGFICSEDDLNPRLPEARWGKNSSDYSQWGQRGGWRRRERPHPRSIVHVPGASCAQCQPSPLHFLLHEWTELGLWY